MITVDDVRDFGNRWFDTVGNGGSAADQAAFFLDPHARIHVVWNGTTFDFEEHHRLHTQWINEAHQFGHFNVTPLNARPNARATGTVYWQAEFADRPTPNTIKAVVGEDWILERRPSGIVVRPLYEHLSPHSSGFRAPGLVTRCHFPSQGTRHPPASRESALAQCAVKC